MDIPIAGSALPGREEPRGSEQDFANGSQSDGSAIIRLPDRSADRGLRSHLLVRAGLAAIG